MKEEPFMRVGVAFGVKRVFTYHDPQTNRYWCEESGKWYESKDIDFNAKPKKRSKKKVISSGKINRKKKS